MDKYLYIILGAALGAVSRYELGAWSAGRFGDNFPYGTWAINLIGSFVLGLFLTLHLDKGAFTPNMRFLVATGWCASFTTYSTFSWETLRYLQEGSYRLAALYAAGTFFGCLAATWGGAELGRIL